MSPIDLNCRPALAPHVRLQIDPVSGEPVLLFSEGLLILNPTAHEIVQRCDGKAKIQEIVIALGAEYEIDETTLQSDALDCLRDLASRNLVIVKS
jgi:pyrroloquinoline quinone biosynthesis protein D